MKDDLAPVISIAKDHGLPEWLVKDLSTFIQVFFLVFFSLGVAFGILISQLSSVIAR